MSESEPRPMTLLDTVAAGRQRSQGMEDESGLPVRMGWAGWTGRVAILAAVVLAPWLIGSVKSSSLWLLAVLASVATASWWLELAIARPRQHVMPWLIAFVLAGALLGWIQTLPLPAGLASVLTGRQHEIYSEWSAAAILDPVPPPTRISIDPDATWRLVLLLAIGGAMMGAASGLFRRRSDMVTLMTALAINGAALTLFGLLQQLTWNDRLFWRIELTGGGVPFASFVNRNNAAGFLLICFAAACGLVNHLWIANSGRGTDLIISREIPVWRQISTWLNMLLAELTYAKLAALILAGITATGVIATLSRGGVIALLGACMATTMFYGMARRPKGSALLIFPLMLAVIALVAWVGFYDQLATRFTDRDILLVTPIEEDTGRLRTWSETLGAFPQMGWLGAGLGGYPGVHRIYSTLLETVLFEHAENQFVQAIVDAGLPGIMLLLGAVFLGVWYALFLMYRASSGATVALGTMATMLVFGQVIASCFDFGWYVPANTVALSVLLGAIGFHAHALGGRLRRKTWFAWHFPHWLASSTAIVAFSAAVVSSVVFWRYWATDCRLIRDVESLAPARLDLAATEVHLDEIAGLARRSARAQDAAYLGGVCLRAARLKWYRKIAAGTLAPNLSAERRAEIEKNLWLATAPGPMLEHVNFLGQRSGSSFVSEFLAQDFARQELPDARRFLTAASARQPIKPNYQLTVAQLELLRGNGAAGCELIAGAIAMSPGSYVLRERASIALLSSGYRAEATPHLRRMLELDPNQFFKTVALLKNETSRLPRPLDDGTIASQVLPDDPAQLYGFATRNADDQPELKSILLRRAADLMESASPADHRLMVLKADVQLALGQTEDGIELLRLALTSDPNDGPVRYRLARLLLDNDQTREAEEHAERLVAGNNRHQPYIDLYDAIQERIREKAGGG